MPGYHIGTRRPSFPRLNQNSSLARGLLCMVAGPQPQDLVQGTTLTGIMEQRGVAQVGGTGFQFNANDEGLRVTAPPTLQIAAPPLTIAAHVLFTGTPSASANIFGVCFNSTEGNPFLAYSVVIDGSGFFNAQWNNAGSFSTGTSTITPSTYVLYSVIATFNTSADKVRIYANNVLTSASLTAGPTSISYGTGPILAAGEYISTSRNGNMIFYDGMIWNRLLTDNERWMLDYGSPWDLYAAPPAPTSRFSWQAAAAAGYLLVKN